MLTCSKKVLELIQWMEQKLLEFGANLCTGHSPVTIWGALARLPSQGLYCRKALHPSELGKTKATSLYNDHWVCVLAYRCLRLHRTLGQGLLLLFVLLTRSRANLDFFFKSSWIYCWLEQNTPFYFFNTKIVFWEFPGQRHLCLYRFF